MDFENKIYFKIIMIIILIIIIIIIQYYMSWFNILMSNYKTDTSSKVSFKPVPNQTFLFNCFGLTKGIWRFRGEYKYCNKKKKNDIVLTHCLSASSSLYCLFFYFIFFSVFLLSILPLLFFFFPVLRYNLMTAMKNKCCWRTEKRQMCILQHSDWKIWRCDEKL